MRHKRGSSRTSAACKGESSREARITESLDALEIPLPAAPEADGYMTRCPNRPRDGIFVALPRANRERYQKGGARAKSHGETRRAPLGGGTAGAHPARPSLLPGRVARHPRTIMHPAKPTRARRVHTRPARHRHRRTKDPRGRFGGGRSAESEATRLIDSGSKGGAFVGGETH